MLSDTEIARPIRLILSDVDGVLTDGKIIYDSADKETKAFHVRDGLGIKMWQKAGFHFGIITARQSRIVERRAKELGIAALCQGAFDKWGAAETLMKMTGCTPAQTCFIGDDLPDVSVMRRIALPVTVADGCSDALALATWITKLPGGHGAVRELIERLLRGKSMWTSLVEESFPERQ